MNKELMALLEDQIKVPPAGTPHKTPSRILSSAWTGKPLRAKAAMWVYAVNEEFTRKGGGSEQVVMEDGSFNFGYRKRNQDGTPGEFGSWYRFESAESSGRNPYSIRQIMLTKPVPEGTATPLTGPPAIQWVTTSGYLGLRKVFEVLQNPSVALQAVMAEHNTTPLLVFQHAGDRYRGRPTGYEVDAPDVATPVWSQLVHDVIQSFQTPERINSLRQTFYGQEGIWTQVVAYPEKVMAGIRRCVEAGWPPLIPGWVSTTGYTWHGGWERGCGRHGLMNTTTNKSLSMQEEKLVQGFFDVCGFHSPPPQAEYSGARSEAWEDMYLAACEGLAESATPVQHEMNGWALEAVRSVPLMVTRSSRSRKNEILLFNIKTPSTHQVTITPVAEVEDDGEISGDAEQLQTDLMWMRGNAFNLTTASYWRFFQVNRWGQYDAHKTTTFEEWKAAMIKVATEVDSEEV